MSKEFLFILYISLNYAKGVIMRIIQKHMHTFPLMVYTPPGTDVHQRMYSTMAYFFFLNISWIKMFKYEENQFLAKKRKKELLYSTWLVEVFIGVLTTKCYLEVSREIENVSPVPWKFHDQVQF